MEGRAPGQHSDPWRGLDSDDKGTDSCGRGWGVTVYGSWVSKDRCRRPESGEGLPGRRNSKCRIPEAMFWDLLRAEGDAGRGREDRAKPMDATGGRRLVLLWGGTIGVIPGLHQCGAGETCAGNNGVPGGTGGVGINRSLGPDVQVG